MRTRKDTRQRMPGARAQGAGAEWSADVAPLIAANDVAAADALARMAGDADPVLAKEARRALHVLSTRGITPSAPAAGVGAGPGPANPSEPGASEGWVTVIDSEGYQLLALLREDRWGGSPFVAKFIVHYCDGAADASEEKVSRRDLPAALGITDDLAHLSPTPAPPDYVMALLREARASTQAARRTLPGRWLDIVDRYGAPRVAYARPLAYDTPGLEEESLSRTAGSVDLLLREPPLAGWTPDLEAVQPWAERLQRQASSIVYLMDHQKGQVADRVIDEATDALYGDGGLKALRRSLEETALAFALGGKLDTARECLVQARPLATATVPHMNAFARTLVARALGWLTGTESPEGLQLGDDDASGEGDAPRSRIIIP